MLECFQEFWVMLWYFFRLIKYAWAILKLELILLLKLVHHSCWYICAYNWRWFLCFCCCLLSSQCLLSLLKCHGLCWLCLNERAGAVLQCLWLLHLKWRQLLYPWLLIAGRKHLGWTTSSLILDWVVGLNLINRKVLRSNCLLSLLLLQFSNLVHGWQLFVFVDYFADFSFLYAW